MYIHTVSQLVECRYRISLQIACILSFKRTYTSVFEHTQTQHHLLLLPSCSSLTLTTAYPSPFHLHFDQILIQQKVYWNLKRGTMSSNESTADSGVHAVEERAHFSQDQEEMHPPSSHHSRASSTSKETPRQLSALERRPVELLEKIFLYSLNVNLPRASPSLGGSLSREQVYRILILLPFR